MGRASRGALVLAVTVMLLITAGACALRYRHAYGTFDTGRQPVHLYINGVRYDPIATSEVWSEERVRSDPPASHQHSVGAWSLVPVVHLRSKDIVTVDPSNCVNTAAIALGRNHYAYYEINDVGINEGCGG